MIYFLVQTDPYDTIGKYLRGRGETLADRIQVLNYSSLEDGQLFESGFFVFTDMDRLNQSQLKLVGDLAQKLEQNPNVHIWNAPSKALTRYDLLKQLYDKGINRYQIIKASESWDNLQFPVFLREGFGHNRLVSGMITDRRQLEREMVLKRLLGYQLDDILVIEFLNTADEQGIFHKYSALKVGDVILPRYLDFKTHWMVKSDGRGIKNPINRERLAEIQAYMQQNPHHEWLRKIFRMAHIDYGRIDYSLMNGIPQVWEINMNPDYGSRKPTDAPLSTATYEATIHHLKEQFFEQFRRQLERVEARSAKTEPFPLQLPIGYSEAFRSRKRNYIFTSVQQSEQPIINSIRNLSSKSLYFIASVLTYTGFIDSRNRSGKK